MERRCLHPGCRTVLSRYNGEDYCWVHENEGGPPAHRRARPFDPQRAEAREFCATIASAYGYTYAELTAHSRRPDLDELVTLRARLAHYFREQGMSLTAIGGVLCRNHSTVIRLLRMPVLR